MSPRQAFVITLLSIALCEYAGAQTQPRSWCAGPWATINATPASGPVDAYRWLVNGVAIPEPTPGPTVRLFCDRLTSFRVEVQGIGVDGTPGPKSLPSLPIWCMGEGADLNRDGFVRPSDRTRMNIALTEGCAPPPIVIP